MTIPFTVTLDGKPVTVNAEQTATPGLVVHDVAPDHPFWRLSHNSGRVIGEFNTRKDAQAAAEALVDLLDWTLPADDLAKTSEETILAVMDIVWESGGVFMHRQHVPVQRASARSTKGAAA